tara:strand:- start:23 stop:274 length:252 start_codon:yes stop_codon:yes gene_type:complete
LTAGLGLGLGRLGPGLIEDLVEGRRQALVALGVDEAGLGQEPLEGELRVLGAELNRLLKAGLINDPQVQGDVGDDLVPLVHNS